MKKVIYTVLFVKLCTFFLIFLSFSLLPFSKIGYYFNFHSPQNSPITVQTAFSTWDAQHYLFLAQHGYKIGEESDRFFPLLPSLIKLFSPIFGYFFAGIFVANIFSFIGFLYFYLFVKEYTDNEDIAYISLLLLLIFPTSLYFSLIYSEGVFLGLVMPLFYYLYKKRFLLSALCAFLLPLTRPTGIFILVPLLIYALWNLYKEKKTSFFLSRVPLHFLFLPLASIAGLAVYFLIMFYTTGNSMTGFVSQNTVVGHWQIAAFFHPQIFFHNLFMTKLTLHGFTNSLLDRVFFALFLFSLPFVWKKTDPILFSYVLVTGFVPLFGSFMSYMRYMLLAFPLFIALGIFFSDKKRRQLLFPFVYLAVLLQAIFLTMHSLNYWVA